MLGVYIAALLGSSFGVLLACDINFPADLPIRRV